VHSLSDRFLTTALVALTALALAATAAAQPLSEYPSGYAEQHSLAGKPATLAADDFSSYGWGAAATFAKRQAAGAQPSGRTVTAGELMTMDKGYPTYRGSSQARRIDGLNARSAAKSNERYGVGSSAPVRPDDRAGLRTVGTGVIATGDSTDDTAWGDVTAGALGGFGIALLVGIGGFLLISRRRPTTAAH
jgi:hypothetical protein